MERNKMQYKAQSLINDFVYLLTADLSILSEVEVIYKNFPGWKETTSSCKTYDDLPAEAKSYIQFIQEFIGVPVEYVGVGPGRESMLTIKS